MNRECGGGVRIEISHRDILLTFLDRPYLPTFSPVNMMMNNISWRAAEYVSPGERTGSLGLLPMSSSFLCTTLFSESGDERGAGERRESEVDNRYHRTHTHIHTHTHTHTHIPQKHTSLGPSSSPSTPPKHFHINNQAIFLHANPSKRAGANLQAWGWVVCAAFSFQVCPTPWQTFVPLCGTQSPCPVSTDWSEAGCKGGKQHTLSMMLYICTWKEPSSPSTTCSMPQIMRAVLLTAPAALVFVMCI